MAKTWICAAWMGAWMAVGTGAMLLAGPAAAAAQEAAQAGSRPAPAALTIGPGDLVDVALFDAPELSGRFRVDENGDMQVPLLGSIHVAGLTADQAAKLIGNDYVAAQVLKPETSQATVFIEEYATQGITVSGQVKNPGVYPALGVRMLNDVIAAAGGVTILAASQVLITRRNDPDHPLTVEYIPEALKPVIPQVQILPGDSITVPRAGIVYVMGDVNKPGGYVLDGRNHLTVEEAVGLAGGTAPAAGLDHCELVRTLPDGRKEMVKIPVNRIIKGKAPDVAMKDGDILWVPTSWVRLGSERGATAALQIGSAVAIYRAAYH